MTTRPIARALRRILPALLATVLLAVSPTAAHAQTPPPGACTDRSGVTVVVDFTDLGGDTEVGCATGDPETGREALAEAGFTTTDDATGLICAIDARPNPCPETFQGSFWSYWHAETGGAWTSYQVGADSSHPRAGEVEGWRYNDGSTPPSITAPDGVIAAATTTPDATRTGHDPVPTTVDGMLIAIVAASLILLLLLAAALILFIRRRAGSGSRHD